jgi:hypothetical protein
MTDCQAHQQQLEQQEIEELRELKRLMSVNHGKMIGCAQTIRDANGDDDYIRISVESLLLALEEYENIKRRFK